MNRLIPTLFFLVTLFTIGCYAVSYSATKNNLSSLDINERYQQAKFYYNQLETNTTLGDSRDNWLKCCRYFRITYLADPKSEYAPKSLFMLGKIYRRMYERFGYIIDLEESISYYKDCAALFHTHKLADDSVFAVGKIFLDLKGNPHKAARFFNMVITDFPNGDMHPNAAAQMKILSRDFNIALPDVMLGNTQTKNLSNVLPVTYWSSKDYSRIVINASEPVTYKEQLLPPQNSQPRRLTIDFSKSYVAPQFRTPIPIRKGLLKKIRTSQFSQNSVRVTLDIESVSTYKIFSLPDPFRVVVDIRGEVNVQHHSPMISKPVHQKTLPDTIQRELIVLQDSKKKRVSTPQSPIIEEEEIEDDVVQPSFSLARQLGLGVKKVVIDPGHGGKDPGAMANGLKEKDIVLRVAKRLKPLLENKLGCKVVITREKDKFISLEERTAIANGNNADLFISLHINAHNLSKVHGLETYFLNLSTNAEAMRVAARENAISEHQLSDLQDILSDIMKNSNIKESSKLAQHVHNTILTGLRENDFGRIKNLGVKQAPFYVLIGAEMPAILIEMAFITNPNDAKNLQKDDYLNTFAEEISNGIEMYINSNTAGL